MARDTDLVRDRVLAQETEDDIDWDNESKSAEPTTVEDIQWDNQADSAPVQEKGLLDESIMDRATESGEIAPESKASVVTRWISPSLKPQLFGQGLKASAKVAAPFYEMYEGNYNITEPFGKEETYRKIKELLYRKLDEQRQQYPLTTLAQEILTPDPLSIKAQRFAEKGGKIAGGLTSAATGMSAGMGERKDANLEDIYSPESLVAAGIAGTAGVLSAAATKGKNLNTENIKDYAGEKYIESLRPTVKQSEKLSDTGSYSQGGRILLENKIDTKNMGDFLYRTNSIIDESIAAATKAGGKISVRDLARKIDEEVTSEFRRKIDSPEHLEAAKAIDERLKFWLRRADKDGNIPLDAANDIKKNMYEVLYSVENKNDIVKKGLKRSTSELKGEIQREVGRVLPEEDIAKYTKANKEYGVAKAMEDILERNANSSTGDMGSKHAAAIATYQLSKGNVKEAARTWLSWVLAGAVKGEIKSTTAKTAFALANTIDKIPGGDYMLGALVSSAQRGNKAFTTAFKVMYNKNKAMRDAVENISPEEQKQIDEQFNSLTDPTREPQGDSKKSGEHLLRNKEAEELVNTTPYFRESWKHWQEPYNRDTSMEAIRPYISPAKVVPNTQYNQKDNDAIQRVIDNERVSNKPTREPAAGNLIPDEFINKGPEKSEENSGKSKDFDSWAGSIEERLELTKEYSKYTDQQDKDGKPSKSFYDWKKEKLINEGIKKRKN